MDLYDDIPSPDSDDTSTSTLNIEPISIPKSEILNNNPKGSQSDAKSKTEKQNSTEETKKEDENKEKITKNDDNNNKTKEVVEVVKKIQQPIQIQPSLRFIPPALRVKALSVRRKLKKKQYKLLFLKI